MKTMKFLSLAALALTFAACSSNDDELTAQQPAEQPNNGEITITATIEAGDGAATRTLSDDGTNIVSSYQVGEKIAVLFEYESAQVQRDAEVKSLTGTTATVEFTIPADLTGSQTATLVYPATAVNAAKDGADVTTALATQDGSIGNCPEVRTGTGTLDASAKTLNVSSALAAQNAIFKFTTKNAGGTATVSVNRLVVSIDTYDYVVTPATARSELYAALPATSSKEVKFTALAGTSDVYTNSKAGVSFDAGTYYQSTVKLNASALKALVIPKGTSPLKGDKVLFYADGDTYQQAADRPENKSGDKGWGTWSGWGQSTMFFKENGGAQADLSIDGNSQFGESGLNNLIDPSLNYYFVETY